MRKAAAKAAEPEDLSHNLLGQRLGRKGRDTRERILVAADHLLRGPIDTPVTLSAVAREASLGMTTLYLYFSDLTELLLAVLTPIMDSAEESYMHQLRVRWPDERLGEECATFVHAFHAFWAKHSRILHLRNSYTAGEPRMVRHRVAAARPVIDQLICQMDGTPGSNATRESGLATALFTGLERLVTVATDESLAIAFGTDRPNVPNLLRGQTRLLEIAIRDGRKDG